MHTAQTQAHSQTERKCKKGEADGEKRTKQNTQISDFNKPDKNRNKE